MIPSRYRGIEKTRKEVNEVLEDIKAEIESYVSEEPHQLMSKTTVLEIIDKYKVESEDKE